MLFPLHLQVKYLLTASTPVVSELIIPVGDGCRQLACFCQSVSYSACIHLALPRQWLRQGTGLVGRPLSEHTIIQLCPRDTKTGDAPRHWRWRGFITDYYTAESVLQENPSAGNPTTASQDGSQASASKQTGHQLVQDHRSWQAECMAAWQAANTSLCPPPFSGCSSMLAMLQMLARLLAAT